MNKTMMTKVFTGILGFILFLLALVLYLILTIINWGLTKFSYGYFLDMAVTIDKYGNRDMRTLFNATLIRDHKDTYKFGKKGETISSVLGKNKRTNTLTYTGLALAWILDTLDKDHCEKSIMEDI